MKKCTWILILAIIPLFDSAAQENEPKLKKEYFKLYWTIPGGIGNNVIAKANKGIIGVGMGVTFATIDKVHIIGGYEFNKFEITDRSLAGNFEETISWQLYLEGLYKIPLSERFDINPRLSVGYLEFTQRAKGDSYGRQHGPAFSPGFTVDAKIAGSFRLFAGLNYCLSFPETKTNDEYRSFFGTIHMLNITAGLKL